MRKKLNIALTIIVLCIIIAGTVITVVKGLNFDINYSSNKQVTVYIGKIFELEDIKQIAKEATGQNRIIVQKVELYEDMVSIKVKDITDEQIEELNNKINEKYELENTVEELIVTQNSNIIGIDLIKTYIIPIAVSFILVIVYIMVYMIINNKMGKNLNIIKSLGKIVIAIVLVQVLYLNIIAILRIPVNRLTIPFALVLYIITTIISMYKLEKEYKNIKKK